MPLNHLEEAKKYQKFYREELLENVVPFWMNSDLLDGEYGGYISSVDRRGKSYNDDKSVWFQGRCLWTFSTLCEKYGIRDEWRKAADIGKEFLEKCFDMMLDIYRHPENDPFKITPKSYSSTRNERSAAVPMVLVSTAQFLRRCDRQKSDYYSVIVKETVSDILKYHFHPELKASLENVLQDGSHIDSPTGRTINPGHSCENAWFLMSEAVYSGDKELLKTALDIFDIAFERGWDKKYGGILYFVDLDNKPCEQLEWDMKLWWVHNEVLIASLAAYSLTGDEKYWKRFETVHSYAFDHFADKEYGEWYGYLHRDGTVSHTQKGSMWKGPYHLPRCLMLCDEILGKIAEGKSCGPLL